MSEDSHADPYSKTVFGFWLYLLTDFVLFATVLATYFVLRDSTFGGVAACQLFPLSFTLTQTVILLSSAFTIGLANVYGHRQRKGLTLVWTLLTFLLGAIFLWTEWVSSQSLVLAGNGWDKSAFLSAYFTLIGTHILHVVFALLWTLLFCIYFLMHGLNTVSLQRMTCLRLFWQFLSMIWVGIVTIVYLLGVS